jgi:hypothetical protein|tara:strand:+ start:307 stop:831 length:525 start_codon:yes stop_codon:yes gene_type:complete
MLNNNSNTCAYAESVGRAIAFGRCITSLDMFMNTMNIGYYYYANDSDDLRLSPTDPKGSYEYWCDYVREATKLATDNNEDPATWGIMTIYNNGRGSISFRLVRLAYMRREILDIAENDSVQCPTFVLEFGRNLGRDKTIYLTEEGRCPQPQDEAERENTDDLSDWLEVNVSFEG